MRGFIHKDKTQFEISAEKDKSVLEAITRSDNNIDAPCGGKATCGKCKIKITGNISDICDREIELLTKDEIDNNIRLACLTYVKGDFEVYYEDKRKMLIQVSGMSSNYKFSPILKTVSIELVPPSLDNPISNFDNLIQAANATTLPYSLYNLLDELICKNIFKFDVTLYNDTIISLNDKNLYGVAIDIGTTTIAVYLCNLNTGEIIDVQSFQNPQRKYGADVISRINHIIQNKSLVTLQKDIIGALNKVIEGFSKEVQIVVITGNTVMQHIAAGLNPRGIANAPFIAQTLFNDTIPASDIGLNIKNNGQVYFTPCVASYVGGDISTGIIASDVDVSENLDLFIDIGTNGEMGIGNKDGLYFCATAAGPAFEGAHIEMGLAGIDGAINQVYLEDDIIKYNVIGDIEPIGICGSGIIDAIAVMIDMGILDETGVILDSDEVEYKYSSYVGKKNNNNVFFIDRNKDIYLSGKDVREVQLAKAAVCAGILTLLNETNKNLSDINRVILAGGFGAYMNKHSACKIGLIPSELENKIIIAGNTAGMGAVALLCSNEARTRISNLKTKSKYMELSGNAFFMDEYINQMMFE